MKEINRWARYRSVGYMLGRGLCWGMDAEVYPYAAMAPGAFAVYVGMQYKHSRMGIFDGDLSVAADEAFDWVMVGRELESHPDPSMLIQQATTKLKVGGHLIVFLPIKIVEAPQPLYLDQIRQIIKTRGRNKDGSRCGWVEKDAYVKDGHLLIILKKLQRDRWVVREKNRVKSACVVRYGALGDMIMVTPLIRQLAEDGYHITVNMTKYALPILINNPYINNIILQERDAIPNPELGEYWSEWAGDYDKYINLSESIEGELLKVEGRKIFYTSKKFRHETCNKNYFDVTLSKGGYPEAIGKRGEIYLSDHERSCMEALREEFKDKFLIIYAMNGSSHHKIYSLFEPVMTDWLNIHKDSQLITVGDTTAKMLEFEHPRMWPRCGEWNPRESIVAVHAADLVIGPETFITNVAGCLDVPKIPLLSHSTHENLCKYWTNDYCLEPDVALAPCYPCHQLHYSRESCPEAVLTQEDGQEFTRGPSCAVGAITGERVLARMEEVYSKWRDSLVK